MALFESYERREKQILDVLAKYNIKSIEECREICQAKGFDPYKIVEGIQPICFENAKWAYTVGCAIALKKGVTKASEAAAAIGEGLQSFCIPGSVADQRKVGLGHGNLGKMLLEENTECFAFVGRRADGCRCGLLRIWFFTSAAGAGNELGVPAGHHTLQCNAGDAVL